MQFQGSNKYEGLATKVFHASKTMAIAAIATGGMLSEGAEQTVAALAIGAIATSGTLVPLAALINKSESVDDPVTADELLFAAMLACAICPGGNENTDIGVVSFDPPMVGDVMEMFRRATGRDPEAFLEPNLVRAVRETTPEEAAEMASRREMARAQALRGGQSIN